MDHREPVGCGRAATRGGLAEFPVSAAGRFVEEFLVFLRSKYSSLLDNLDKSKTLDKESHDELLQALNEFKATFTP